MAGDWIKMRSDLFTHPKVVRIASALKADTLRTVGGLMSVWCLFDKHSTDGVLEGYTADMLDEHLRWSGFSAAMIAVKWLVDEAHEDGTGLALPEFDTHNGQSAKRRAQDADRKKNVRNASASDADKKRTREEKRREELPVGSTSTNGEISQVASTAGTLADCQAQTVVLACKALRRLGIAAQPAHPVLLDLVARGATVEQLALTASELALKKLGWLGDTERHPELLELAASGAPAAQMNLSPADHAALRAAAPNLNYLAKTLIGRAADGSITLGDDHGHASNGRRAGAGHGGAAGSAAGRAEEARRAGDARDDLDDDDHEPV